MKKGKLKKILFSNVLFIKILFWNLFEKQYSRLISENKDLLTTTYTQNNAKVLSHWNK